MGSWMGLALTLGGTGGGGGLTLVVVRARVVRPLLFESACAFCSKADDFAEDCKACSSLEMAVWAAGCGTATVGFVLSLVSWG